jgi:hypothetical protein
MPGHLSRSDGQKPAQVSNAGWMFERFGFVGEDLTIMWRWLRDATFYMDTDTALRIHPGALNVRQWLQKQSSKNR